MAHTPGQRIGAYVVRGVVDDHGGSAVLEVEHTILQTAHALKILDGDDDAVARALHHGARLQATVDHPNVVRCTDAGFHEDRPWLVTEWVHGGTLAALLDDQSALPVPFALRLFRGVARGVRALHAVGVVHRDLKPSNVLLALTDGRRRARITDLTLAKSLDTTTDHGVRTLSQVFKTIGTPEYMAPEQAADPATVDPRADLFSLGVLLYEMLTNEVPFDAAESWRVLVAARIGRYRPLRELRPDAPEAVEQLIADLLRPVREERLPSSDLLVARLEAMPDGG